MLQSQHKGKSHQRDFTADGKVTLWEDDRLPTPLSSSIPGSRLDIYPPLPHISRHLEEMDGNPPSMASAGNLQQFGPRNCLDTQPCGTR